MNAPRRPRKALGAGADEDDVRQEARLRMLERGIDPAHGSGAGFRKNVRREEVRRSRRQPLASQSDASESTAGANPEEAYLDALASGGSLSRILAGDVGETEADVSTKKSRAKPMRVRNADDYRAALLVYAIGILSDWTRREWGDGNTAELRDAVGVDETAWPVVLGSRARLALRRAVVIEVDEHAALGRLSVPLSVLAAACVVCGDIPTFPAKEFDAKKGGKGVTPGKELEKIQAGLAPHRKNSGVAARHPAPVKRVRLPKKRRRP